MPVALDVLFSLPLPAFTYLPPLQGVPPGPGQRVVAPWQSGVRVGVVLARRTVDAGRGLELRHLLHPLEEQAWLTAAGLEALTRAARAAGVAPGAVLASLNPPGLQPELLHQVRLRAPAPGVLAEMGGAEAAVQLPTGAWLDAARLPAQGLEFLRQQGLVDERGVEPLRTRRMLVPLGSSDQGLEGARRKPQRRALRHLIQVGASDSAAQLARDADVSASSVRSLVSRGYAGYADLPLPEPPLPQPPPTDEALPPTAAGQRAPTGSGAIVGGTHAQRLAALLPLLRADLAAGRSVLVLAPELAVAADTAALLGAHLPTAYLTGDATDDQRLRLWRQLPQSGPLLLVGTYLTLLAPLPQLGRVVVLDTGSSAYKLQSGARLLLPKTARQLAEAAGVPLTLLDVALTPDMAVATPLEARLNLPLPQLRLHVADLNQGGNWPVHPDLIRTLGQVAERGRQAVLLAPRRGFSGAFGCPDCGWQAPCPNCDLTLRFHQQESRLRCHQCGHEEAPPSLCPQCGGTDLGALRGAGTQWIASQLRKMLPNLSVYRYDRDRRDDLTGLYSGEPGVVVGTLAVLGLRPLPGLSLIGVTHFDSHIAAADFRAEEEVTRTVLRLAELGANRRPLMVVQTHTPHHELLQALGGPQPEADLNQLLQLQLERRQRYSYPPFSILAKLQFTARDRGGALDAAQRAADALSTAGASQAEVLGPASAPVERLKGRFVFHVLLRAVDENRLEALLAALPRSFQGAKLIVDVDPREVGALLD